MMPFSEYPEFNGHEEVIKLEDGATGLRGFIAIHNTTLGPATGGTRYWHYASESDALRDALKLSRAMTYKCALAGVANGGGKAVLIADPSIPKSPEMLRAHAAQVNRLGGRFYTGEDVGITMDDIRIMREICPYIGGTRAGDLAPWAALGIFHAMKAAARTVFGRGSLAGRTVAVKGLGKVGFALAEKLRAEGADLIIADIDPRAVARALAAFPGARVLNAAEIHSADADIYSPCALGGELNEQTIPQLRCRIVCGGANTQLMAAEDGARLYARGIVYVPDYLANAGGLINVMDEHRPDGYNAARVAEKVRQIGATARVVIALSEKTGRPTSEIADRMAETIIMRARLPAYNV